MTERMPRDAREVLRACEHAEREAQERLLASLSPSCRVWNSAVSRGVAPVAFLIVAPWSTLDGDALANYVAWCRSATGPCFVALSDWFRTLAELKSAAAYGGTAVQVPVLVFGADAHEGRWEGEGFVARKEIARRLEVARRQGDLSD